MTENKQTTIQPQRQAEDGIVRGNIFRRWWIIVRDGFKNMTWGKPLIWIILIKLFVMFAILKAFFFPDFLASKGDTDEEQQDYVVEQFVERSAPVGVE